MREQAQSTEEALSQFWGATSLHGAVFRKLQGFVFWHCSACRSPASPSGLRSCELPAHGAAQMEVVCKTRVAMLEGERDRLTAEPERDMRNECICHGLSFYSPACHPSCPAAMTPPHD